MTLIVILMVVIVVKLIARLARRPRDVDQRRRLQAPQRTSLSAVGGAAVFGFLSFAGFEGAASLGEETDNPGGRSRARSAPR